MPASLILSVQIGSTIGGAISIDLADRVRPVGSGDDVGQAGLWQREHGGHQGRVDGGVVGEDPADVAAGRRIGVLRDGLGHVRERLAALDVGERLVRGRLGGGLLGVGRGRRPGRDLRLDRDHRDVALLLLGRLVGQALVDLRLADRDPLLGGELGLEGRVDQPVERRAGQLLAGLVDRGDPGLEVGVADPPELVEVAGLGLRLVEPELVDQRPVPVGVLVDRLAVDLGHFGEMRPEVLAGGCPDEGDEANDDDKAKGQVDVEVAPILAIAAEPARPPGGRLGARGHSDVASCR